MTSPSFYYNGGGGPYLSWNVRESPPSFFRKLQEARLGREISLVVDGGFLNNLHRLTEVHWNRLLTELDSTRAADNNADILRIKSVTIYNAVASLDFARFRKLCQVLATNPALRHAAFYVDAHTQPTCLIALQCWRRKLTQIELQADDSAPPGSSSTMRAAENPRTLDLANIARALREYHTNLESLACALPTSSYPTILPSLRHMTSLQHVRLGPAHHITTIHENDEMQALTGLFRKRNVQIELRKLRFDSVSLCQELCMGIATGAAKSLWMQYCQVVDTGSLASALAISSLDCIWIQGWLVLDSYEGLSEFVSRLATSSMPNLQLLDLGDLVGGAYGLQC
jgi:hypothetical protein